MANPPRDQQTPENEDPDLDQDESDLPDETLAIEPIVEEVDESEFALPEPGKDKADKAVAPYDPVRRYLAEIRRYPFLSKVDWDRISQSLCPFPPASNSVTTRLCR